MYFEISMVLAMWEYPGHVWVSMHDGAELCELFISKDANVYLGWQEKAGGGGRGDMIVPTCVCWCSISKTSWLQRRSGLWAAPLKLYAPLDTVHTSAPDLSHLPGSASSIRLPSALSSPRLT